MVEFVAEVPDVVVAVVAVAVVLAFVVVVAAGVISKQSVVPSACVAVEDEAHTRSSMVVQRRNWSFLVVVEVAAEDPARTTMSAVEVVRVRTNSGEGYGKGWPLSAV